jgi:hypothetical protein
MTTSEIHIPVTEDSLWFLERQLNLFDFLELFPMDAVSPAEVGGRGIPILLNTDLGFTIESDIDRKKMALRNRSQFDGWMKWTAEKQLQPGDEIVIRKIDERLFDLKLLRKGKFV